MRSVNPYDINFETLLNKTWVKIYAVFLFRKDQHDKYITNLEVN